MEKIGTSGLSIAVVTALALLVLTLCLFIPIEATGDLGICLPSPNEWGMPHGFSWVINTVLLFLAAFALNEANKKYNFIPSPDFVMPVLLLIITASSCVSSFVITTSTLLLAANIIGLYLLFATYESYNSTQDYFVIASIFSIGSMFQYAFLMMIPAYIIGGLLMKSMRFKEVIAFIFGLAAPYWIVLGLGIVPMADLQLPESLKVFNTAEINNDLFIAIIMSGIAAFTAVIFSLYNGIRLFTRNSRLRAMHLFFNIMGISAMICMILDFNNFLAYFGTLALWFSVQTALLLELYHIRGHRIFVLVVSAVFITGFILSL